MMRSAPLGVVLRLNVVTGVFVAVGRLLTWGTAGYALWRFWRATTRGGTSG
ncbi:MAG: hypothetical protein AB2385_03615 [Symbiobacterium sp.]|uniref:hypothetical protein n=1 Tax=Symbiobacterium sp. TaxID=1971213 RepID=UPI0034649C36